MLKDVLHKMVFKVSDLMTFRCKQLQLQGEMKVNFVLELGVLLVLFQKLFLVSSPQPPKLLQELFKRWQLPLTR